MKKFLPGIVALMLLPGIPVFAQEDTEPKLWTAFKAVVDATDPAIEAGYFFNDFSLRGSEAFTGISGALYSYDQHEKNVASLRAGVALEGNHKVYLTAQANLINITTLYAPIELKEALSPGLMGNVWEFLGKYGRAGFGPGFDIEAEQFGMVATFGGTVQF